LPEWYKGVKVLIEAFAMELSGKRKAKQQTEFLIRKNYQQIKSTKY